MKLEQMCGAKRAELCRMIDVCMIQKKADGPICLCGVTVMGYI